MIEEKLVIARLFAWRFAIVLLACVCIVAAVMPAMAQTEPSTTAAPEAELEELERSHICHSSFLADRCQFGEAVTTIAAIATTRSLPRTVASANS